MRQFFSRHTDRILALALVVGALILYTRTLAPGVLDGDSGEWQYMLPLIGVAHSTGYPLYVLVGKFFTLLIPIASIAYRVNLFSAVCAALAVGVLYALAVRVTKNRIASALASALFALAPTLWASAVQAEVYALNTLLGLVVLYFAWRWYESRNPRDLGLLAFSLGLALDNHRVIAFLAFGLLLLLWFTRASLNPRRLILAALLVLLPLTLYAYIPLRANQLISQQDPANWQLYPREDAILKGTVSAYYRNSVDGFFNLVLAFDNRNKLGFQDDSPDATFSARAERAAQLALDQFGWLGLALAVVGAGVWLKREWQSAAIFFAPGAGIAAIAFFLRGESTQYYFSLAYAVVALCIAHALAWLFEFGQERIHHQVEDPERSEWNTKARRIIDVALGVIASLWLIFTLVQNYARLDNSANTKYVDYAQTVLNDNLAPNAVVIAGWEIATPMRYYQFVEGQRADLLIIHESPIRPQYQKLYDAAHQLQRPFYLVEFTPEDQLTPGPRFVQAIALPLSTPPAPQFALNQKIARDVTVVGYSFAPNPPQPGQMNRVEIFYRVDASVHQEFNAELSFADLVGNARGDYSHEPVTDYHRTYFWNAGEYYRDVFYWQLPADAPSGLYTAELSWFNKNENDAETKIDLAPFRVGKFYAGETIAHPQAARVGDSIDLLGFDVQPATNQLRVVLYWRALKPVSDAFTVFVHLADAAGIVRAQKDSPPYGGNFPTNLWTPDEIVRDEYVITLPAQMPNGTYHLDVGMYLQAEHPLTVTTSNGVSDRVTLAYPLPITNR